MEIRTYTIPFAEIVGPDATEVVFGPDDYLQLRSLWAYPANEVSDIIRRQQALTVESPDEDAEAILKELLTRCVVGWNLNGPDGPIPKPTNTAEVDRLPTALALRLVPYLATFRGRPDPTPAA